MKKDRPPKPVAKSKSWNEQIQEMQGRGVQDAPDARDWPEDFKHENGNYQCICIGCQQYFNGHKRRMVCKVCDAAANPQIVGTVLDGSPWMGEVPVDVFREVIGGGLDPLVEDEEIDVQALADAGEIEVPKYEDMTREQLIETCKAHDAYHQEHHEWEESLKSELAEMANQCDGYHALLTCTYPRAGKLMLHGKRFLVVAEHEHYYFPVYGMIRSAERAAGTWSVEDEAHYVNAIKGTVDRLLNELTGNPHAESSIAADPYPVQSVIGDEAETEDDQATPEAGMDDVSEVKLCPHCHSNGDCSTICNEIGKHWEGHGDA